MSLDIKFMMLRIFKRPRNIILYCIGGIVAYFIISVIVSPGYIATAKILVIGPEEGNEMFQGNIQYAPKKTVATTIILLKSRQLMEAVANELNLKHAFGKKDAAKELLSMVDVKPVRGTDIIEVSVISNRPKLATQIANTICKIAVTGSARELFDFEKKMLAWLTDKGEELRKEVEEASSQLREFKESTGIMDLKTEHEAIKARIESLQNTLVSIRSEKRGSELVYGDIKNQLEFGTKPEDLQQVQGDSAYKDMESQYLFLKNDKDNLLEKYQPNHPSIIEMAEKISSLEESMAFRIEKIIDGAKRVYETAKEKEAKIQKIVGEENDKLFAIEEQADKYALLLSALNEKEAKHKTFIKSIEDEFGNMLKIRHIDLSEQAYLPAKNNKPSALFLIFTGALLGLIIGGLYNIIKERKSIFKGMLKREPPEEPTQKHKGMYIERVREEGKEE